MLDKVIANGYCIGCGACAALSPKHYGMVLDENGRLQAAMIGDDGGPEEVTEVCPFSDEAANEDELAALFLKDACHEHEKIGRYIECYAGRVTDEEVYGKSSSGGIGRWLAAELLKTGEVDTVLHVVEQSSPEGKTSEVETLFPLYHYTMSTTPEAVLDTARSAYYPVEMSEMIRLVMERPGRYAVTGVPCFIKALRNIARIHPLFRERLRYTIGIVCGHLKSTFYAEMIGWQLGVLPSRLQGLNFRVKIAGRKANEKGVSARSLDTDAPVSSPKTVQELFGTNYGHGYFKYSACDYCDDVLGETADVSIGDAWLPEYLTEGTSIVVVRNEGIRKLLQAGLDSCSLRLTALSAEEIARSQDGGLRHRREGLAYRLFLKKQEGTWVPTKRVRPQQDHIDRRQRRIFYLRMVLVEESFYAFREARSLGDWEIFRSRMSRLNQIYADAYADIIRSTFIYKILRMIYRKIKSFTGQLL